MIVLGSLDPRAFVVVDMDSGMVLGTNLRIVRVRDVDPARMEDARDNDSEAWDMAEEYGRTLFVEED